MLFALQQAEIIPIEPDTGNAETGKRVIDTYPFSDFLTNKHLRSYEKVFSDSRRGGVIARRTSDKSCRTKQSIFTIFILSDRLGGDV